MMRAIPTTAVAVTLDLPADRRRGAPDLRGDRSDRPAAVQQVGDHHPLVLGEIAGAARPGHSDLHRRIVDKLPGGIANRAPVPPPGSGLPVDPDHPARLGVADPLSDQPRIQLLLLSLNPARRHTSSTAHRKPLKSRWYCNTRWIPPDGSV
jgi:hypothetical protein